ncbi:MAG: precorrin-6y C5,15-methyltransferase (decarboxylating) subunit CbiE [Desulfovibrio sp.]|uniref:precorrin-6y C5,15-methyltransferase (decarboxylating) subunit CbiE n=1 Tax=Desulfovibrio sp. 7SRBS1 TaxID=3378064 RepID=UPI003B40828E
MIVDVIGLGLNPSQLSQILRDRIAAADVLVGGKRQLESFPDFSGEQVLIASPLESILSTIRDHASAGRKVMVMADGDPLFYGIGKRIVEELGRNNVRIIPGVTTLQTAAARLGIPWHDITLVSLHGRGDFAPVFAALTHTNMVAVFTDEINSPAAIAQAMLDRGADRFGMWVFEDLESELEKVGKYNLSHAVTQRFSPLNFVVLERTSAPEIPLRLGIPDDDFVREENLITKGPVRAAGLATLSMKNDAVVWDIGAGCGAVSIETAVLAHHGAVYAIEREQRRYDFIRENIRRTGAYLVNPILGEAPECFAELPDPDRIFIGGGIAGHNGVLESACNRLKPGGRLTTHCILLDSLNETRSHLNSMGWPISITQIQGSLSKPLAGDMQMKGLNPVFIVATRKPNA